MNKQILEVPGNIKFVSEWEGLENLIPSGHVIINKQLTGCGFTEWLLTNNIPMIWDAPRVCLLENKDSQHNEYIENEAGNIICVDQWLYYARSTDQELEVDKDLEKPKDTSAPKKEKSASDEEREVIEQSYFETRVMEAYNRFLCEGRCPKFCVTYDSFRRLKEVFQKHGVFDQFVVAVDEFQVIFQDQRFKANTEMEFMYSLQDCKNVVYVSATPMIEEYLDQVDEFKDLPYLEMDWRAQNPGRVITPKINAFPCKSINPIAKKYITDLKNGKFAKKVLFSPLTGQPERTVESKELVFYVNSIRNICEIIRQNKLTWQDTCIICADSKANRKKIREAFTYSYRCLDLDLKNLPGIDKIISRPPKRGERRKPVTLCSKTAYIGSDMYSDCARTIILSDSSIECLSVDITLDLPQIMGRQRMDDNPWKYEADLYYHIGTGARQITKEEFDKRIAEKIERTESLLRSWSRANDGEDKHNLANVFEDRANTKNYREDYVAVNKHAGADIKPQMNKLVMIAEQRAFDIQKLDYADRFSVMAAIDALENLDLSRITEELAKFMYQFNSLTQFQEKMRLTCDYIKGLSSEEIDYYHHLLKTIPNEYGAYINALGVDYILGHGCQRSKLEEEYRRRVILHFEPGSLEEKIFSTFKEGERWSKLSLKEKLGVIYQELGIEKKGKASDIEQWFNTKSISIYDSSTGKRNAGFELIKK